ncbi:hypothetical protein WDU94_010390 [Cyamophila willieti]
MNLVLTIRDVAEKELGVYTCEGHNSLAKASANVRIYEIKGIELEQYHKTKKMEAIQNQTSIQSSSELTLADTKVTIWISVVLFCYNGAFF